ncbi:MAG: hypothetical protein ACREX0_09060 [Noviherbaspirillum sp.]
MTAKCSIFIATSLDGFISRGDGSIDWLDEANAVVPEGEDCGYANFMSGVDALVMGRRLFGSLSADVLLEHFSTRAFEFGFVQSKYRVLKSG